MTGKDIKLDVYQALSDDEKVLVNTYLETRNISETARRMGRSHAYVSGRLKKPHIAKEIQQRQIDNANRADITNEWIIQEIKDVAMKAKQDASWSAALKGLEMLGKITGIFEEAENSGITYNVMGSVILAKTESDAKALLEAPERVKEEDYIVMDFEIGEDIPS